MYYSLVKPERLSILLQAHCKSRKEEMNINEFAEFVGISVYNPYIYNLFVLMDPVSNTITYFVYSIFFILIYLDIFRKNRKLSI